MRIKCVVIKALVADLSNCSALTSAAGLVLLSRYFDGACDRKAAAAPIKVGQMS